MKRNVEIKARAADPDEVRRRAMDLATAPPEVIVQEDIFFPCRSGRLKLRKLSLEEGELIWYHRPDVLEPAESRYTITRINDPAGLERVLTGSLGARGVVRKTRTLLLVDQTRIHLDDVQGLGSFVELEVVLSREQTAEMGEQIARRLMEALGIRDEDLLDGAYIDMLE
jgi:adenylate cyclase